MPIIFGSVAEGMTLVIYNKPGLWFCVS